MSEFNGQLGRYKVIKTQDDSQTLWSEFFDENCHSSAGAFQETLFNYVLPCLPDDLTQMESYKVLEVGYGLGVGLKATIEHLKPSPAKPLHFISLELDPDLVRWSVENQAMAGVNMSELQLVDNIFQLKTDSLQVDILIGDARENIKNELINNIHAIYQDPFSPKKNPSLWTTEWFESLKNVSHKNCKLATYSASVSIRKSILKAGWHPQSHSGFAHKRERTMATLSGPIDQKLEKRLRASSALALHDEQL